MGSTAQTIAVLREMIARGDAFSDVDFYDAAHDLAELQDMELHRLLINMLQARNPFMRSVAILLLSHWPLNDEVFRIYLAILGNEAENPEVRTGVAVAFGNANALGRIKCNLAREALDNLLRAPVQDELLRGAAKDSLKLLEGWNTADTPRVNDHQGV